ncbi:cold shock domain-containing protein [Shewanella donghaensis]|uniref:cold shock domain-containing protein n=1 Tax=Shewanella donghaensis TaxID=238836 RepID=UPI0011821322|nr:cold shock domain-containing protein [Shewanella donghaensis]
METGRLVRWNSSKGFGFIEPDEGGRDVFIHISILKHMARKPIKGDYVEYIVEQQADGKIKAIKANIKEVAIHARSNQNSPKKKGPLKMQKATSASGTMSRIIIILIVIAIGRFAYQAYYDISNVSHSDTSSLSQPSPQSIPLQSGNGLDKTLSDLQSNIAPATPKFECEAGKTHCSHMRSCEEAIFYIKNCPDTQMDGNGDGVPCERQFCN